MSPAARRWWIGAGVFVLLAWLVGYPLLITTFAAFVPEAGAAAGGGTSAPFAEFVQRPDEWTALFRSLWISLASVGLAGAVGAFLALQAVAEDLDGSATLFGCPAEEGGGGKRQSLPDVMNHVFQLPAAGSICAWS